MGTPPKAAIGDLVPLMYRARWVRFGLSGQARSRTAEAGSGGWEEWGSLELTPEGRYRVEVIDDEGDREVEISDRADGPGPFSDLMAPSRLLPDYDLKVTGRGEFLGRAVIAIAGSPRQAGRRRTERVSGLVDAELGILLRYQQDRQGQTDGAEFTRLTILPPPPAGGDAQVFTDDEVNLLYRSDLPPQRFAAQCSEQADVATMMRLAREEFSATKFGSRNQWLWRPSDDDAFESASRVGRLAVAMPGCYLIEATADPGRRPSLICCDGRRLWRAYPDRVAVRAAEPLPPRIATIIDPAWLLEEFRQVSVLGETAVDGRPALHVKVSGDTLPAQSGPLSGIQVLADQVEAFIDRELGICLRQVSSYRGHQVLSAEFTDLTTEVDPALFEFVPAPGMKVITGGLLAEIGETPASMALHAAKGVARLTRELGHRWLSR